MAEASDPRTEMLGVETPESVAFTYELAGLGSRGLALLVDTAFLVAIIAVELIIDLAITWVVAWSTGKYNLIWSLAIFGIVAFVTYWGYFMWLEYAGNGRTPGKRRVGIRVVRDDGGRISFGDSAVRNLIRIADLLPGMYGLGIASVVFSSKGKRLGDLAAGTVVVRDRGSGVPTLAEGDLGHLDTLVAEFLERRAALTSAAREQIASELLGTYGEEPASNIDSDEARLAEIIARHQQTT